jgi:hypothetical protein
LRNPGLHPGVSVFYHELRARLAIANIRARHNWVAYSKKRTAEVANHAKRRTGAGMQLSLLDDICTATDGAKQVGFR